MTKADVAAAIYERSKREALAGSVDWLCGHDGDPIWIPADGRSRGQVKAFAAAEFGWEFTDVRVRCEWMRVDLQAIRDLATDLANELEERDDDGHSMAYTWEGEGFMWSPCAKIDAGAIAYWRCEVP